MTGGFRADPAGLDAVAVRVDGVGAALAAARPAGERMSDDAFGLVGALFAGAAAAALRTGSEAVVALTGRVDRRAGELRLAARDYELADTRAALAFAGVEVPRAPGGTAGGAASDDTAGGAASGDTAGGAASGDTAGGAASGDTAGR